PGLRLRGMRLLVGPIKETASRNERKTGSRAGRQRRPPLPSPSPPEVGEGEHTGVEITRHEIAGWPNQADRFAERAKDGQQGRKTAKASSPQPLSSRSRRGGTHRG